MADIPVDDTEQHIAELETQLEAMRAARDELQRDRDQWRAAHLPDVEAECLAGCVRAIEDMRKGDTRSAQYNVLYNQQNYAAFEDWSALGNPIGRILLSLAARYHVDIGPTPPPERPRVDPELEAEFRRLVDRVNRILVSVGQ